MGVEECNNEIKLIKEKIRLKRELKAELRISEEILETELKNKEQLDEVLIKEEKDVEAVEGKNIATFFHKVIGDWDEKLMKEMCECREAKERAEQCKVNIEENQKKISELKEQLKTYDDLENQYESLLNIKEGLMIEFNNENKILLLELRKQQKELEEKSSRLKEVYKTGEHLFYILEAMLGNIDGAEDYALANNLSGGIISNLFNNSSIDNSNDMVYDIGCLLREFNKGLIKTEVPYIDFNTMEFYINSDTIHTYIKHYRNHWVRHSKIKVESGGPSGREIERVLEKVTEGRNKVHGALCGLKFNLDDIEEKIIDIKLKRKELLEEIGEIK